MVNSGVAAAKSLQWLAVTVKTSPKDRHEAAAMFVHAVMLQNGFRPASYAPPSNSEYVPEEKMPEDWNDSGYGGKYKHHQSGLTFEMRMVPLGSRLSVTATVVEQDDKTYSSSLRLDEYVRDDAKIAEGSLNWDECFKNVESFASNVQLDLAYKLVPESVKTVPGESTTEATRTERTNTSTARRQEPSPPRRDPLMIGEPRQPRMPYPMHPGFPTVGADDLIDPGLGRYFPGIVPQGGGLVGPDHPLFDGRRGPEGGIRGPGRGGFGLPPGAVPPGARFDPFGPPGVNGGGFDPSRFGGPDPDHDRPPPDMYW